MQELCPDVVFRGPAPPAIPTHFQLRARGPSGESRRGRKTPAPLPSARARIVERPPPGSRKALKSPSPAGQGAVVRQTPRVPSDPLREPGRVQEIWLILPVVICSSQRLSHACLSASRTKVEPRKAHYISCRSQDRATPYMDNCGNSRANTCRQSPGNSPGSPGAGTLLLDQNRHRGLSGPRFTQHLACTLDDSE